MLLPLSIVQKCLQTAALVLGEKINLVEFEKTWLPEFDDDRLLWKLMNELNHFLVDTDIHLKDPEYKLYQRKTTEAIVSDIKRKYKIDDYPLG